jgi:hypothetical protein
MCEGWRRVRHIPERIIHGRRLGRHIEHDERSRAYEAPRMVGPIRSVEWKRHCPAFDQGELGSCTGNAMAGLLMTEPFFTPGRELTEDDAVKLYSAATSLDRIPGHYPPDDTGSSGLAIMKAAVRLGFIRAHHHVFSFAGALAALQSGPVIMGLPWYEGFDTPIGDRAEVCTSGEIRGGHEIEAYMLDIENGFVGFWQSWGPDFGDRGRFVMSFETLRRALKEDGDVTVAIQ